MENNTYTQIRLRNDSQSNWLKYNPVLLRGELAISFMENDEVKIKIGDGVTAYALLPFFGGISKSDIEGLLTDYAKKTDVPTAVSQLTNDEGYITMSDVELKKYVTLSQVTEQINLILAEKDYANNTRVNEIESKIPTDIVTSEQLQAVENIANGKATMAEVDTKLTQYTKTTGFATINNQPIVNGGNIEIQGGSTIDVDAEMNLKSTNPVQNKVVTKRINDVEAKIPLDTVTSAQLQAVETIANGKTTMAEVEAKGYATDASLATVAKSGSFNDLTDKPNIPSGVVVDLTLDKLSNNAVANSAVTTKIEEVEGVVNTKTTLAEVAQQGYAKSSEIPTDTVTSAEVEQAITAKGYQTSEQVESAITAKGYQTAENVESAITAKNYTTLAEVNQQGFAKTSEIPEPIVVDDTMSDSSTNPVQNKIINDKLNTLKGEVDSKTTLTEVEAKGYATTSAVDTKLTEYTKTTGFATINNQPIVNGGNIDIQGGGSVTVDTELSTSSENPVQNKVITTKINSVESIANSKTDIATVEQTITAKNYVAKDAFATINGNVITEGGNINIQGGGGSSQTINEIPDAEAKIEFKENEINKFTATDLISLEINAITAMPLESNYYFHSGATATTINLLGEYKVVGDISNLTPNTDYLMAIKDGYVVIATVGDYRPIVNWAEITDKPDVQTAEQVEQTITAKNYVPKDAFATINGSPITEGGDIKIEAGSDITVDERIDINSNNPVENVSIAKEINTIKKNIPNITDEEWVFTMADGSTIRKNVSINMVNYFYVKNEYPIVNNLTFSKPNSLSINLEYSTDGGNTWTEWTDFANNKIPMEANSKVYLRGTNNTLGNNENTYSRINAEYKFSVGGDLTTLLSPKGNVLDLNLNGEYSCFYGLFQDDKNLINAKELILPSTTLTDSAYAYMFKGCSNLVSAPVELPSLHLRNDCYYGMFWDCYSLIGTPYLPAAELSDSCYCLMFNNCSSIKNIPIMKVKSIVSSCFNQMFNNCTGLEKVRLYFDRCENYGLNSMFQGCTNLNYIEINATFWIGSSAGRWLKNVSPTGTFVKPKELATDSGYGTIPTNSENGIPEGWTIIDK